MKRLGVVQTVFVWLAVAGFCLPQSVLAASTAADAKPMAVDVALRDGGVLLGLVVDPQGAPAAKAKVVLWERDQQVATAVTDDHGRFAFRSLRGGVYQIVAANGHGVYRLWVPGTAPPTAQQGALVVAGQEMVRGQCCPQIPCAGALCFWLSNPWVIAGIVAVAVAVPLALNNGDDDEPKSPSGDDD